MTSTPPPGRQERAHAALENLVDPVVVVRAVRDDRGVVGAFVVVHANAVAAGRGLTEGTLWVAPDGGPGVGAQFDRYVDAVDHGRAFVLDAVPVAGTRARRYADLRVVPLADDELLVSPRDVTAHRAADREREHSELRFRSAFDGAPVGMVIVSLEPGQEGTVLEVNQALADIVDADPADLVGRSCYDFLHPDEVAPVRLETADMAAGRRKGYQHEKRLLRADGSWAWVRATASAVARDGVPAYVIEHVEDITARRRAEAELARRALYDPLTGLANRVLLMDRLGSAVQAAERDGAVLAVLFLDLDRFKDVNDTLGHTAGDDVIRELAGRLARLAPLPSTVARLAGDEFVLALRVADDEEATRVAERVVRDLARPVMVRGFRLVVQGSVGVTTTRGGTEPEDLLREADLAMHHAKGGGPRRWALYDEPMHRLALERLDIEESLRRALAHDGFRLLFQPIVDTADGRIVSAEALLRLEHPTRGLLGPESFIGVAEGSDLIVPIGRWVLEEACRWLARWVEVAPDMQVTVNVSTRQVSHLALADQVADATRVSGADPSHLLLEITEHVLLDAGDDAARELARVTDAGPRLAIDDFGTGYASLSYLKRFPVSVVKIDRSFVNGLDRPGEDTAIVEAVIGLARTLGLGVVGEGVETAGQLAALQRLGCGRAQGFHIGRPMTGAELGALLMRVPRTAPRSA
ncbi:EAL domain-containing protein [Actinotalea sp. AC32]|nr:EAL domain-containing protein [Actinotalea sp. AC32]